jgi:hypothetical protein
LPKHVCIRRPEYVAGTSQRPEIGVFTQAHATRRPVPWSQISTGDDVWMKWTGGPIVARAKVQGFRVVENCNAERLRDTTNGFKLHELVDYWKSLPPIFFGMTIYLQDEQWLQRLIEPKARSRGESWIVLNTSQKERDWLEPRQGVSLAQPPRKPGRRGSRTIRAALRFEVFRRDSFTCQYCGRRAPNVVLHADHVQPWSKEGPTTLENLATACSECNLGKGARS